MAHRLRQFAIISQIVRKLGYLQLTYRPMTGLIFAVLVV